VGPRCSPIAAGARADLGEDARIVVLSVTEGDDKPRKYPHMFRAASASESPTGARPQQRLPTSGL
jgi:hypothetical protein